MVVVWGRKNSVNVQKALWALEEAGVEFQRKDAGGDYGGLDTVEYAALNPNKRVPTLVDGETVIWESNAVTRYIAAKWGNETLWPADLATRATADMWMDWMQTTMMPRLTPVFWALIRTPADQRDMQQVAENAIACGHVFRVLDAALADRDYVAGDTFTMGDIPVAAATWRYVELPIERPELLNLSRWMDRMGARPAFQKHIQHPLT